MVSAFFTESEQALTFEEREIPFHFAETRALNGQMCVSGVGGDRGKEAKCLGLGTRETLAQPAHLLTSCVSLIKLINFSKPQITHVQK